MIKLDLIAGARPNFIKISPVINEIIKINSKNITFDYRLIHTGQHYDENMSNSFFKLLNIPEPDINLNCGSGSHAEQTSKIMISYEKVLKQKKPDCCIVFGDVNSTLACSVVAKKFNIKVAHVEAGIRSFDSTMPEEINRIVTDSISDYFFTTSLLANKNLINSGVNKKNIFFVGNTMIDTLLANKNRFKKPSFWDKIQLKKNKYFVLTLHRPSNVDLKEKFKKILETILNYTNNYHIIFPIHPRTKKMFKTLEFKSKRLHVVDPMNYLEFNFLIKNSNAVITDSGGITEETTVLKIPCFTLRDNTERPETVTIGTNVLVGTKLINIKKELKSFINSNKKKSKIPQKWDGKTSIRIIKILKKLKF